MEITERTEEQEKKTLLRSRGERGEEKIISVLPSPRSPRLSSAISFSVCSVCSVANRPKGRPTMRFMILVKATAESEAGVMPETQLLADMGKFNEELVKAGIMQAGEGLHP